MAKKKTAKKKTAKRAPPQKDCPGCKEKVPAATRKCTCGHIFTPEKETVPKKKRAPKADGYRRGLLIAREQLKKRLDAIDLLLKD